MIDQVLHSVSRALVEDPDALKNWKIGDVVPGAVGHDTPMSKIFNVLGEAGDDMGKQFSGEMAPHIAVMREASAKVKKRLELDGVDIGFLENFVPRQVRGDIASSLTQQQRAEALRHGGMDTGKDILSDTMTEATLGSAMGRKYGCTAFIVRIKARRWTGLKQCSLNQTQPLVRATGHI